MDKTAIRDRYLELEAEVDRQPDEASRRHKKAAQGPERLRLMAECKATGNHVYETHQCFTIARGAYTEEVCMFCGADAQMQARQLVRNLGTVAPFGRFN